MNGPTRRNRLRHGLYPTQKAVRVPGSRALHSRSPALGCALHEWRVSLIADRDGRDVMAAQDGARNMAGAWTPTCFLPDLGRARRYAGLGIVPCGPLSSATCADSEKGQRHDAPPPFRHGRAPDRRI